MRTFVFAVYIRHLDYRQSNPSGSLMQQYKICLHAVKQKTEFGEMGQALFLILLLMASSGSAQQRIPAVITERVNGSCPTAEMRMATRNGIQEQVQSILLSEGIPLITNCPCGGGPGQWRRIAHLDMSDPDQQCPPNWRLNTAPERACGRLTSTGRACDSAIFPSGGRSYSRVCGRVIAYQKGRPEGLLPNINPGLDGVYLEGVSLTHGAAGLRQHIWSFVVTSYETHNNPIVLCQCSNTNIDWPYQLPSFIGNDYFCDTGNRGTTLSTTIVYSDDPLWDGEGCGPTSTCCEFNTPPWFCTTLPQPTTDDIELRICADQGVSNEDTYVRLVDIYTI